MNYNTILILSMVFRLMTIQALARFRQNEITKEEMLAEFRKPYSFKQLSIHNQSFCDIMKIKKVYQSKIGEELQKWQ